MDQVKGICWPAFSTLLLLSLIAILPLSSAYFKDEASTVHSMIKDVEDVVGRSFDYIVVGGGTSGCPLAATLSERYSVLLVERGGSPYGNPLIEDKLKYYLATLRTDEFTSVSQPFFPLDGKYNARGRVLGGTTAINGGFYSRAHNEEVEKVGWDPELVREAYEWVESKIIFPSSISAWQFSLVAGMVEAGIRPLNDFSLEHIVGSKVGAGIFDAHLKRHTSADLLAAGNPANLTILLNATVQSVIFDDAAGGSGRQPRARGVRFIKSDGDPSQFYQVYLNDPEVSGSSGDVILSAGTLGSPQILMLSGIGPKDHLMQFNITPLIDAREVGQSVQDNPVISYSLNYSSNTLPELHPDPPQVAGIVNGFRVIIETAMNHVRLNESIHVQILGKVTKPLSRGWLRLQNTDPRKNPLVKFNYLAAKADLDDCVTMLGLIDKIARTRSVGRFLRKRQVALEQNRMSDFCKMNVVTIYHYHGGCVVGSVVDTDYRVLGAEGLRVVDFSTFHDSLGTNPMATLLMLGRYQGVKMLRERMREMEKATQVVMSNLVSQY